MSDDIHKKLQTSHFSLGQTEKNQQNISVYYHDYRGPRAESLPPNQKEVLGLRGSHFNLGDYKADGFYNSSNITKSPYPRDFKPPHMNKEKLDDLRTHHFMIGGFGSQLKTSNMTDFCPKEISDTAKKEQSAQVNKMRKHNHEFKDTKLPMFNTSYGQEYNKKFSPNDLAQGSSKEELKKKVVDLRQTNLVLGQDPGKITTTSRASYINHGDALPVRLDPNKWQLTSFSLGNQVNEPKTISQEYFVEHPPGQKSEEMARLKADLRNHHFKLGDENHDYATEARANYRMLPNHLFTKHSNNSFLQANHFSLGSNNAKPDFSSNYAQSFNANNYGDATKGGPAKMARDQKMDRGSNWSLGDSKPQWVSETRATHQPLANAAQGLVEANRADLRKAHFSFNDHGPSNGMYTSLARASYVNHNDTSTRGVMEKGLLEDLRASHYEVKMGNSNFNNVTDYRLNFTKMPGKQHIIRE